MHKRYRARLTAADASSGFPCSRGRINVWGKQYKIKIANVERKKKDVGGLVC